MTQGNVSPADMEHVTTLALAKQFIGAQVAALRAQIGNKRPQIIIPMRENARRWMVAAMLVIGCAFSLNAQVNLTGRSYENKNIIQSELDKAFNEVDQKIDSLRTAQIAKEEKEKGRKLTASELSDVEKDVKQARDMMIAMKKGMQVSIGLDFTSERDAVMRMSMKIDDDVLKKAGVSWIKRKAMKAALAVAPEKQKAKYHIKGNLIIFEDPKEPDTMRISEDGKYIYGTFDKQTKFKLSRTK